MDFKEQPIRSYPFKNKRLLIIDWASLSYHQLWSMRTKSSKQTLGSILPEDEEMIIWRTTTTRKRRFTTMRTVTT